MARRHFPTCEGCGGPIMEPQLVEGVEAGNRFFWHKSHAPGRGRKNPTYFFASPARPVYETELATEKRWRAMSPEQRAHWLRAIGESTEYNRASFTALPANIRGALMVSHKNPSRVAKGFAIKCEECGEPFRTYRAFGKHGNDTGHVGSRMVPVPKGQKNIFFRHRIREHRLRRQLTQAAELQTQAATAQAARSIGGMNNPHYPAVKGKAFEQKWERLVQHVKKGPKGYNAFAVATAALGGYPASRAAGRGNPFRSKLSKAKGKVARAPKRARAYGKRHPKGVRIAKGAGRAAVAGAGMVFPEVAVASKVASKARTAYKARKGKRNPTPPRQVYIGQQLDRAERYISQGRIGEAVKYVERASRMVRSGRGDPDEDARLLTRVRTIEEALTMTPPPAPDELQSTRTARAASKAAAKLPSLELPSAPPDPPDEFFGKLAEEAKRQFPGRDLKDAVGDLQHLYHYGLTNAAKRALVQEYNISGELAVNPAFWRVYEAYLNGEFVERGGKLLYRGPGAKEGGARTNPSFKDIQPPVVDGARAVRLDYVDKNGVLWIHKFGEDNLKPRIRVKKGLLTDKLVVAPTTVGPRGIGDDQS